MFIIMSGFLMAYNYYDREITYNPFIFALKKIWALYPLHIFCMVIVLVKPVLSIVVNHSFSGLFENIKYFVCNVLLVQAWIPNYSYYYSLNAVSWYLCICVFFYFLFPFIIRLLRKINSKRTIFFLVLFIILLEVLISVIAYFFASDNRFDTFSAHWVTYIFPISRLCDFLLGCCFGLIVTRFGRCRSSNNQLWSLLSLIAFLGVLLLCVSNALPFLNMECLKYSLVFMPVSVLLICTFSGKSIFMKKIVCLKPVKFLSELTPYAFLMHTIVLRIIKAGFCFVMGESVLVMVFAIIASFVLTLFLSWIYQKLLLPKVMNVQKRMIKKESA